MALSYTRKLIQIHPQVPKYGGLVGWLHKETDAGVLVFITTLGKIEGRLTPIKSLVGIKADRTFRRLGGVYAELGEAPYWEVIPYDRTHETFLIRALEGTEQLP